uniref:Photolyase/cryptochrome alpha/beta domain-containing protein n=1 Tax=Rhabditophanes sp. KR3021 TaxID=114890 RepID=A0AC35TT28_9BILA
SQGQGLDQQTGEVQKSLLLHGIRIFNPKTKEYVPTEVLKKKLNINFAVVFIKDQKAKLKAKIDKLPPDRPAKMIADWDQNFVNKKPAGRPPKGIFEVLPSTPPPPDPPVVLRRSSRIRNQVVY